MGHRGAGVTTTVKRILNVPLDLATTKSMNGTERNKTGRIRLQDRKWLNKHDTTGLKEVLMRMKVASSKVEEHSILEKLSKKEEECITTKAEDDVAEINRIYSIEDTMCHLMISDFSSRSIFNSCHQMFMSHRAIYFLVFDISMELDFKIYDEDFSRLGLQQKMSITEITAFHLRSIHMYRGQEKSAFPKVFLIGTHGDLVDQKVAEARMKELKQEISKMPILQRHIVGEFIVNNTDSQDIELEKLKNIIFEKAKEDPFWGKEIPASWMPLEKEILSQRDEYGKRILTIKEIRDLNQDCYLKLESDEEIAAFFTFQNSLGNMMFFYGNGPDDMVVLDSQWLIDSLAQIITHEQYYTRPEGLELPWEEFIESAKLKTKLLETVWANSEDKTFIDHKEKILEVLDSTELVCMPKVYNTEGMSKKLDYFIVPFMLKPNKDEASILQAYLEHCKGKSSTLCFVFKDNFIPPAIFARVQGACIKELKIKNISEKNLVFHEASVFKLNRLYDLHLQRCQHTIQVTITSDKADNIKPHLCKNIFTFLKGVLLKITCLYQTVSQESDLPFSMAIRCDRSEGELDVLLPWEGLLASETYFCKHQDPEKSHNLMTSDVLKTWLAEDLRFSREIKFPDMPELSEDTIRTRKVHLNMQDLGRLARSIPCSNLSLVADKIFTQREINQVKSDNSYMVDQNFAILMTWNSKIRDGLSIEEIQQILADAGKAVSTDFLKQALVNKDYTSCFEGIPSSFLDSKLNDISVDQISLRTGIEYQQLAIELGLSPHVIKRVITETPTAIDRTRALLRVWMFCQGAAATFRAIGQAIVEVGIDTTILYDCYCVD